MQNADNLRVTEQARVLARAVYAVTRSFPSEERFGLGAQMRRAAISVGSNICEGCGRHGNRELLRFLHIAYGSASELQFQVGIASDVACMTRDQMDLLDAEVVRTKKMLARLIKSLRPGPRNRVTA